MSCNFLCNIVLLTDDIYIPGLYNPLSGSMRMQDVQPTRQNKSTCCCEQCFYQFWFGLEV
jgi:hypothetical protein